VDENRKNNQASEKIIEDHQQEDLEYRRRTYTSEQRALDRLIDQSTLEGPGNKLGK